MNHIQTIREALKILRGAVRHADTIDTADIGLDALAELEKQEPVAWMWKHKDSSVGCYFEDPTTVGIKVDHPNYVWTKLYASPVAPQPRHITDGSPCWCNPTIEEHEVGNVIIHNHSDHWQQYAKEGETAQQCIERHRSEQDALLELLKQARAQQPQANSLESGGIKTVEIDGIKTTQQPQAEAVPSGYVLVPVEPTAEMKNAAQNRCRASAGMDWSGLTPQSLFGVAYRAMIDAALAAAPKGQS